MSTNTRTRQLAPVVRPCALCGQPKTILPESEEHRKAHLTREIAFVCQDCATQIRMQVEAAG
ncbi:MAG: hypothetical protein ACOY93_20030 [Bacillota bacterium]